MALTSQQIKTYARSIGVDLIGITSAQQDPVAEINLKNFIAEGRHGDMKYLEDYKKRTDPVQLLPNAKSVIVIAINYYRAKPEIPKTEGQIAMYAYGRDYHKVLKKLLKKIDTFIKTHQPNSVNKLCVDSTPISEKSYAVKAGLGFIGKNSTLITKEFGSWVLLGEILTTVELATDNEQTGTCGSCERCIKACPTLAIRQAGVIDANRCISYLTIEYKGEIKKELANKMDNRIFGCDICQEVCPYNLVYSKPLQLEEFKNVKIAGHSIALDEILQMQTPAEYLQKFAGSPLMRAKLSNLKRNAQIAKENI